MHKVMVVTWGNEVKEELDSEHYDLTLAIQHARALNEELEGTVVTAEVETECGVRLAGLDL